MRVDNLPRIDSRPVRDEPGEIRAFMGVRNEMLRLPQTLDHHREIGVARFFVIDNASTDGTREFLLAQPDCHVFLTHSSYSDAACGVNWYNALLNEYGVNHWCLTVDADEWFIYPGWERKTLSDLAMYLERTGAQGVFSFLLDMYGSGSIADSIPGPQHSFLDICPYFDSQYEWYRTLYLPVLRRRPFPGHNVAGGPRWRWLLPHWHRYYYLLKILWQLSFYLRFPLPMRLRMPPILRKIPFVRWLPGTRYVNAHVTTPMKLSEITGVLLHFKFLEDFHMRAHTELNRTENPVHGGWATELSRYHTKLTKNPATSFYYLGSMTYQGSDQLIALGLLREDEAWRQTHSIADDPFELVTKRLGFCWRKTRERPYKWDNE